ncbi:MAG: single-stranded DNA-binding protein [Clostridia bacterium]|nr:single-stranded DNA-binding protein [Clostridia bacterium]
MINKAILMGRLTRDPELRHTGTGTPVCSFSIAIDNGYGENRQTDFINCVAWNKTAEFVSNYFTKGRMIIVIGRISTRSWEGQDGKRNYTTEVIANEVSFGESKRSQDGGSSYQAAPAGGQNYSAPAAAPQMPQNLAEDDFAPLLDTDDDLPF